MGIEIERKFLVKDDSWRDGVESETHIMQGYLSDNPSATVRVRVKGVKGYLTIKGRGTGLVRPEYEYEIPVADAEPMLRELSISAIVDKVRYRVRSGAHVWDLDVFSGDNAGLVMAEVELDTEDEAFDVPTWAGQEVTDDTRYYNAKLAQHPYCDW